MAEIRVRVGQPDLRVNVGQQDAIKVLASNTSVFGGIGTFSYNAGYALTSYSVIGGIASVSQLDVSGISTFNGTTNFIGITTFVGNAYFSGNITGTLTTIDGGRF